MAELLPRLKALALLAHSYDIGFNIDAEEADRLELSLDLLESLVLDSDLAGWDGIGFVVQAYQKRVSPCLISSSISRAAAAPPDGPAGQGRLLGQRDQARAARRASKAFRSSRAKFTPTCPTSPARGSCWRRMMRSIPQFATHNAQTLATIHALAGENFYAGQYEFQCLHGMGEPLYRTGGRRRPSQPPVPDLCAGRLA